MLKIWTKQSCILMCWMLLDQNFECSKTLFFSVFSKSCPNLYLCQLYKCIKLFTKFVFTSLAAQGISNFQFIIIEHDLKSSRMIGKQGMGPEQLAITVILNHPIIPLMSNFNLCSKVQSIIIHVPTIQAVRPGTTHVILFFTSV